MPSNKKKKSSSSSSPTRSRTFTIELYPEWANFNDILAYIKKFNYAYIVHDKDVANQETGEIKKMHAHVVLKYRSRRTLSSVKAEYKTIGVPDNLINTCNERAMLRYLIHVDDLDKYQYQKSDVITNMQDVFEKALFDEITPPEQLEKIGQWIDDQENKIIKTRDVQKYAIKNNCYAALRSNGSLIGKMISEHNHEIDIAITSEKAIDKVRAMYVQSAENKKYADSIADKMAEAEVTGVVYMTDANGNRYAIYRVDE